MDELTLREQILAALGGFPTGTVIFRYNGHGDVIGTLQATQVHIDAGSFDVLVDHVDGWYPYSFILVDYRRVA